MHSHFSLVFGCRTILSIYIHKFLRILTSGAKSGARSSRDAESGARMANRFLKKKGNISFAHYDDQIQRNLCKCMQTVTSQFCNVQTKENTLKYFIR